MEMLIVFKNEEFLAYDAEKAQWQLGDFNNNTATVAENAAVVVIDPLIHETNEFQALAVGGFYQGQGSSNCSGLQFYINEQNCV